MTVPVLVTIAALVSYSPPAGTPSPEREAVEKGLRVLNTGAAAYLDRRECFSCHHQALPLLVWESAALRGFASDRERVKSQVGHTIAFFTKTEFKPRSTTTFPYALLALKAGSHAADAVTEKIVEELLARQQEDGSWPEALVERPPAQGSLFTVTALAIEGVSHYATDAQRKRADAAVRRGREWLRHAKPETTEDLAFHLRGLAFVGEKPERVAAATRELLKRQQVDGGWAQTLDRDSDPYATAVALNGLRAGGFAPDSPAYRKGVSYLLKTQGSDGGWVVTTRAKPVQVFFDNGDPGGKSQFLAFTATGWAVLAILETLPSVPPAK